MYSITLCIDNPDRINYTKNESVDQYIKPMYVILGT